MKTLRYAAACVAVACGVALIAWLTAGQAGLLGVLAAAAVALPVQIGAFAAVARTRVESNGFLLAWTGGTLLRMLVVGGMGWWLATLPGLSPAPTLLGLAGLFFVMLMMEPWFLGLGRTRSSKGSGT